MIPDLDALVGPSFRRSLTRLGLFALSGLAACGYGDTELRETPAPGHRRTASPRLGGSEDPRERRHLIVVIGDGMQLAHEIATSRYLFGRDDGLSFHALPERVFKTTWDVSVYDAHAAELGQSRYAPETFDPKLGYDPARGGEAPYPIFPDTPERREYFVFGPYPDSASTATAMSTGTKTDSSNIAWAPGDAANGALESITERLRRTRDMSNGFVTTGPISHATPASWFAHNTSRSAYLDIAREILLASRPEVVIGGGLGPQGGGYVDEQDLEQALRLERWVFVQRTPGEDGSNAVLAAADTAVRDGKGLLGLFGGAAGNFESPVPSDSPLEPSVRRGNPEDPRLAEASVAALEVLSRDADGFFLLVEQADIDWANHANHFSRMIGCVWDLHEAVAAITAFVDRPDDAVDWENTTLIVTADHANSYLRLDRPLVQGDLPTETNASGVAYPDGDVSYGTGSHTNELVMVYAKGRAAPSLHSATTPYPGLPIIDDTAIYRLSLEATER